MEKENKIKYYKYSMNPIVLNIFCLVLMIILIVIMFLTYKNYRVFTALDLLILIFWFILHEILHYLGFLLSGKIKTKDLVMGMYLEKGIFYCMCKSKINKKAILISLLFPLFFIGIVTLVFGYIFDSYLLIFLSYLNIAGAGGDILMSIQMLKFPKDINYFDLDDPISYYITSSKDLSKIKVLGLKLIESKEYDKDKLVAKDHSKIKISKVSLIFLLIYFVSLIILFIDEILGV